MAELDRRLACVRRVRYFLSRVDREPMGVEVVKGQDIYAAIRYLADYADPEKETDRG